MSTDFNLLDDRWIPALFNDGRMEKIGIRDAFLKAHTIRQIATPNPMDSFSIVRLLLALLYWCKGNPPEDLTEDKFPEEWFSKLDQYRDYFNLFGDSYRFFQVPTSGREKAISYLFHEIPTGTNVNHFRHSQDGIDGLCPACCALGLVRLPVFTIMGGRSFQPGINGAPPIYYTISDNTLFKILLRNWKPTQYRIGDPYWIMRLHSSNDTPIDNSLLWGMTFFPRNVWLGEPTEETGLCFNCSSDTHLVKVMFFAKFNFNNIYKPEPDWWSEPQALFDQASTKKVRAKNIISSSGELFGAIWNDIDIRYRAHQALPEVFLRLTIPVTDQAKFLESRELNIPPGQPSEKVQRLIKADKKVPSEIIKNYYLERLSQDKSTLSNLTKNRDFIRNLYYLFLPSIVDQVSKRIDQIFSEEDTSQAELERIYTSYLSSLLKAISPAETIRDTFWRNNIGKLIPKLT